MNSNHQPIRFYLCCGLVVSLVVAFVVIVIPLVVIAQVWAESFTWPPPVQGRERAE